MGFCPLGSLWSFLTLWDVVLRTEKYVQQTPKTICFVFPWNEMLKRKPSLQRSQTNKTVLDREVPSQQTLEKMVTKYTDFQMETLGTQPLERHWKYGSENIQNCTMWVKSGGFFKRGESVVRAHSGTLGHQKSFWVQTQWSTGKTPACVLPMSLTWGYQPLLVGYCFLTRLLTRVQIRVPNNLPTGSEI